MAGKNEIDLAQILQSLKTLEKQMQGFDQGASHPHGGPVQKKRSPRREFPTQGLVHSKTSPEKEVNSGEEAEEEVTLRAIRTRGKTTKNSIQRSDPFSAEEDEYLRRKAGMKAGRRAEVSKDDSDRMRVQSEYSRRGSRPLESRASGLEEVSCDLGELEVAPRDLDKAMENLFHTRCKMDPYVFSVIIDGGSCTNVVSTMVVDKLNLPLQQHPRPYQLQLFEDQGSMEVTHQASVAFAIGKYKDELLCDVVPMESCHMLLGRPWQVDREVTHDGRTNTYSFVLGDRHWMLKPLSPDQVSQDRKKIQESFEKYRLEKARLSEDRPCSNLSLREETEASRVIEVKADESSTIEAPSEITSRIKTSSETEVELFENEESLEGDRLESTRVLKKKTYLEQDQSGTARVFEGSLVPGIVERRHEVSGLLTSNSTNLNLMIQVHWSFFRARMPKELKIIAPLSLTEAKLQRSMVCATQKASEPVCKFYSFVIYYFSSHLYMCFFVCKSIPLSLYTSDLLFHKKGHTLFPILSVQIFEIFELKIVLESSKLFYFDLDRYSVIPDLFWIGLLCPFSKFCFYYFTFALVFELNCEASTHSFDRPCEFNRCGTNRSPERTLGVLLAGIALCASFEDETSKEGEFATPKVGASSNRCRGREPLPVSGPEPSLKASRNPSNDQTGLCQGLSLGFVHVLGLNLNTHPRTCLEHQSFLLILEHQALRLRTSEQVPRLVHLGHQASASRHLGHQHHLSLGAFILPIGAALKYFKSQHFERLQSDPRHRHCQYIKPHPRHCPCLDISLMLRTAYIGFLLRMIRDSSSDTSTKIILGIDCPASIYIRCPASSFSLGYPTSGSAQSELWQTQLLPWQLQALIRLVTGAGVT